MNVLNEELSSSSQPDLDRSSTVTGKRAGPAPSRSRLQLSIVGAVACGLAVCVFGVGARDDDYITYWVAERLALTGHLVNINGASIEQSSSLAHVVLLALLYFVTRLPLPLLGFVVGLASLFGLVFLAGTLANRIREGTGVAVALVVGLAYPLSFWATGGLETTFAAFLLLAYCASLARVLCLTELRRGPVLVHVAACLLVVSVRPDTLVVAVLVALAALAAAALRARSDSVGRRLPDATMFGASTATLTVLGATLLLSLFRLAVFHSVLPQPEVAKEGGFGWLSAGFSYVFTSFPYWAWVIGIALFAAGAYWCAAKRTLLGAVLGSTAAVGTVAIFFTRGDWMGGARLLCPYLAPGLILVVLGAWSLGATWRKVALAALLVLECLTLVLFADGTTWLSSSYYALTPSASTAFAADFGSPFGATVTSSTGTVPSLPWYTAWDFVHTRDAIFLKAATPALRKVVLAHAGRSKITIASFQAGMVAYTWQNEFPNRLSFIDTDNVVTSDFSTCAGLERSFAGDVISFPQWVKDAGGCAPPLPDLIFSLDAPSYTPQLTRHYHVLALVHVTFVRHGLFTSSKLEGTEFLAERDGWSP
jgi:hypothetical protein